MLLVSNNYALEYSSIFSKRHEDVTYRSILDLAESLQDCMSESGVSVWLQLSTAIGTLMIDKVDHPDWCALWRYGASLQCYSNEGGSVLG